MYEAYKGLVKSFIKNYKRMALQKRITPKQISRLPLKIYDGEIVLVKDIERAQIAVNELLDEQTLGFDIESRPAFAKGEFYPPSIMQLAGSKKVFIFQIQKLGGLDVLLPILENENIVKVGAAINHDIQNLYKIRQFSAKGFYDLGTFSGKLKVIHTGLRNLAAIFLRVRISKSSQMTDWSKPILSPQQISYAATDAWVSREILIKMLKYL